MVDNQDEDAVTATHIHEVEGTGWERYTREQIEAFIDIAKNLVSVDGIEVIAGHEDIAKHKLDPGPMFPINEVHRRIFDE